MTLIIRDGFGGMSPHIDYSRIIQEQHHEQHMKNETDDLRHFCFTLDLRRLKILDESILPLDEVYVQYSYAFFGSLDPIRSFPGLKFSLPTDSKQPKEQCTEAVVPQGFCAFNFATTRKQLQEAFNKVPLMIEVIRGSKFILGTGKLEMGLIFDQKPSRAQAVESWQKKCLASMTVPIRAYDTNGSHDIALIEAIMCLQDLGSTETASRHQSESPVKPAFDGIDESMPFHLNGLPPKDLIQSLPASALKNIDDLLMEAALEIEIWKEKQLILFRTELEKKEKEYLDNIQSEIEERDAKRDKEQEEKLQSLEKIEAKLKASMKSIEDKEKEMKSKEDELNQKVQELNLRIERLDEEIKDAINDAQGNYEEKLHNERRKNQALEDDRRKLLGKIALLEEKLKDAEETINKLRARCGIRSGSIKDPIPNVGGGDSRIANPEQSVISSSTATHSRSHSATKRPPL